MSGREILLDRDGPFQRAAVVTDGRLTDLIIDRTDSPSRVGAVVLGRVTRFLENLNAAFVTLDSGPDGFLPAADVRPRPRKGKDRIGTLLRSGQTIPVQIKAEPGGDKGPTLTMDVSLPGRTLVHLPYGDGISISKRLTRGEVRESLIQLIKQVSTSGGWIVRASALDTNPAAIMVEAEALANLGRDIQRATQGSGTPRLLLPPPDAHQRALIEHGTAAERVLVATSDVLHNLQNWCRTFAPDLEGRLVLHKEATSLFDHADCNSEIVRLTSPRVPLPGGGSLVIERTEALTAIDVNGGERGNPLAVNLTAAAEIARQLRLRNLAGIIVVDFVNLSNPADRQQVLESFAGHVANDPAGTHVYGMSRLGLVEMTRSRRGPPLAEVLAGKN